MGLHHFYITTNDGHRDGTNCYFTSSRGHSHTRNPVAHLKERFHIGQSNDNTANRSRQRFHSQFKDHSNSRQHNNSTNNAGQNNSNINNTSLFNSTNPTNPKQSAQRRNNISSAPNSSGHNPPLVDPNCFQIQEILSVLKSFQEDMASVRARIHVLELANQRISRLELCLTITKAPPYITQSNPPTLNMSFSGLVLPPPTIPAPRSITSFSSISVTADKDTINKERAEIYFFQRSLDNKFNHLSGSIERFISSISGGSSSDQVNKISSD
ncbi:hypothetical protein RhiirA5_437049 [Rhizophagus irregularis]|uniref:Uncharacterized protein n=1 Tax=Rhizophagus irregularis TaxID=588596 RepID=A0A2N0NL17_9GLOM|nr:hypothetical protein RhiirA5_437049 [Rhizophagus irregularis]